jgi:type II secretion system protein H
MRGATRQAGFTLTELMVGVVVMGITLAATAPAVGRYMRSASLDSAAKDMAGHIRLTRQKAVAEGKQYLFLWYNSNWYYIISDDDNNGYYTSGEQYDGPIWLPDGITAVNATGITSSYTRFLPNGSCSQSGTFQLFNDRGESITMTLLGPTGQVMMAKDHADAS